MKVQQAIVITKEVTTNAPIWRYLSPDPKSRFPIWETTARLENRECNFMGVVESDSNYYGFLIEQGVCSNDIWSADHDFGYEIGDGIAVDAGPKLPAEALHF